MNTGNHPKHRMTKLYQPQSNYKHSLILTYTKIFQKKKKTE